MTLRSTVRALKPLQALQICCGLSAAASRAFSRGNGANSVRPRFLSSVTAHPQTLTLLSKYVAFDHHTYNVEDWKGVFERVTEDKCGADVVEGVVALVKQHVAPQTLQLAPETVEHVLTTLIDDGLYSTCNEVLRLLPATALQEPKVVGMSIRTISAGAGARAATKAIRQLAAAGFDCRAAPIGYIFSLAEGDRDIELMRELVEMVSEPPDNLRTLALQHVNPDLGVVDATSLPHLMRCQILEAYLHAYAKHTLQRAKTLTKSSTKESVVFRLMHSCTDVLVLLADERTERTTVERRQLQQFLANLDVPVYSLNPLDEYLGNQQPFSFDDVEISDEVRHQWKQYHQRFKYLYLFHLYEPAKGVRGNGRSEMLLIPGPAICAWMFGQAEFRKLLNLKADPVVSAKDKLFASIPKSALKRLAAFGAGPSSA